MLPKKTGQTNARVRATDLVMAIELRCPSCDMVRDPNPDGCAALCCPHCGRYYCSVCAALFNNGNAAHKHAHAVHGNVFPHPTTLAQGHRRQRQLQLRVVAQRIEDREHRTELVEQVEAVLRDVDPTLIEVKVKSAVPTLSFTLLSITLTI